MFRSQVTHSRHVIIHEWKDMRGKNVRRIALLPGLLRLYDQQHSRLLSIPNFQLSKNFLDCRKTISFDNLHPAIADEHTPVSVMLLQRTCMILCEKVYMNGMDDSIHKV